MKVSTSPDRFAIEHEIGAGGMGTVFRARDREAGGVVALKVLRRGRGGDSQRFDREARVLADLTHPAIVRYVAHGLTAKGEPYLAMEWLEGEDLASRLKKGRLSPLETIRLGAQVGFALGAAHAQGVVHRDIKPSNLFLAGGDLERVKLLDFGVARWSRATQSPTATGTMLGTPAYMSPEQARGDKRLGPEADVFSLGCVLFECLTGQPPFAGENLMATLGKLMLGDPPRVKDFRAEVPPFIAEEVEIMMEKSPKKRPPNGEAVGKRLEALVLRVYPAAPDPAPPRPKKPSGFASVVDAASRKPDGTATLCDEVVGVLSKYIPMAWPMVKAQCQRLKIDPAQLESEDLAPLTEALLVAASRFTGSAERSAMRADLTRLEVRRRRGA